MGPNPCLDRGLVPLLEMVKTSLTPELSLFLSLSCFTPYCRPFCPTMDDQFTDSLIVLRPHVNPDGPLSRTPLTSLLANFLPLRLGTQHDVTFPPLLPKYQLKIVPVKNTTITRTCFCSFYLAQWPLDDCRLNKCMFPPPCPAHLPHL